MESKPTNTYILQVPITEAKRDEIDAVCIDRTWSRAQASRHLIDLGLRAYIPVTESEAKAAA